MSYLELAHHTHKGLTMRIYSTSMQEIKYQTDDGIDRTVAVADLLKVYEETRPMPSKINHLTPVTLDEEYDLVNMVAGIIWEGVPKEAQRHMMPPYNLAGLIIAAIRDYEGNKRCECECPIHGTQMS